MYTILIPHSSSGFGRFLRGYGDTGLASQAKDTTRHACSQVLCCLNLAAPRACSAEGADHDGGQGRPQRLDCLFRSPMKRPALEALGDSVTCQVQSGDQVGGTENRLGVGASGTPGLTPSRAPHTCWMNTCGCLATGRCPEQLCVPGADFTNSFYLLNSFPTAPESPDLDGFLAALTAQCASLEELRLTFRPQMDPRWVLGSCFPGICFQKREDYLE